MFRLLSACAMLCLGLPATVDAQQRNAYGLGRAPTQQEIDAWDIDVRPDGHGVKKGAGTVVQGQKIYDEQCASCHGTFGESNSYMPVAGGVRKDDLRSGRASALKDMTAVRTLGTKLNYATTLWDYIYRAMPWTNPQSLTADQTYAVTAYVLHLNEIVGADFELNEKTLLSVQMPNRNGLTTAHGLSRVNGRPDVQGTLCMKDCVPDATIASALPEFARNQSGNLAEQRRPLGPMRGIDTTKYGNSAGSATPVAKTNASAASGVHPTELLARYSCTACHGMTNKIVGPGFAEIAGRYQGQAAALGYLSTKIREGGQGVWGSVPMPSQSAVKEPDVTAIAQWLVNGAK